MQRIHQRQRLRCKKGEGKHASHISPFSKPLDFSPQTPYLKNDGVAKSGKQEICP
jgi:hypothetical protein